MLRAIEDRLASFLTPERARVYARLVTLVIGGGYALAIVAGLVAYGGFTDLSGAVIGADYSAFYGAGQRVLEGRVDLLYDLDAESELTRTLVAPAPWRSEVHPFVSPPYWALFFVPLAALPYPLSVAVFTALSIACLVVIARVLRDTFPQLARIGSTSRLAAIALGFFPVLLSFLNGQTSMLSLACFAAFFVLLRRERDLAAGLVIGLCAIKPPLLIGPMVIALAGRRPRVIVGAAISACAWIGAGMALMPDAMRTYRELAPEVVELLRSSEYHTWGQTSLFGLGTLLLDPISHTAGTVLGGSAAALGVLGVGVIVARTPWTPGSPRWDLAMAAALGLGLLASPHLFLYDSSLFVLPLAIVLARIDGERDGVLLDGGPVLVATGVMSASLFVGPYLSLATQSALAAIGLPAVALQLCTLAMLWFTSRVYQRSRSSDV